MHLLSFRYNHHSEQDLQPLIDIILKWLKDNSLDILRSTGGEHAEASSLHIHYHLQLNKELPFKAPPLQTFKRNNPDLKLSDRQLSIKYSFEESEKNVNRFLQYPLKEDRPIESMIFNIPDIQQLIANAKAEYEATKIFMQKKKAEQDKKNSKKQSLFAYLDSKNPLSLYTACQLALEYYRDQDDSPHPQQIIKNTETWAYKRQIWSDDDIIKRYTNIKNTDSDIFREAQKICGNI